MPAMLSRAPAILPGVPTILAVPAKQICIARLQSRARPLLQYWCYGNKKGAV